MAPRGRTKKTGLQRIDAAFDHLMPFGFSKLVISKTIKNLLKVYGGDEGWVFIEEACYKVVIDTILEQQENEEKDNKMEVEREDADTSMALEICNPVVDAVETSSHPELISDGLHSGPGGVALISDKDRHEDELPDVIDATSSTVVTRDTSQSILQLTSPSSNAEPCQLQESNGVVRHRRQPCYGCISESESERKYKPAQQGMGWRIYLAVIGVM
ncbi:uncharacterized protein A4U43_C05F10800 [Asparagus officinalis]|uniref:WIYLD domain-containing protein n=1 Tax=Asparagus officinalis TaxID=4686 RepID=A0A5P1EQU6_ASPOF|nr:probable inactive histone-lysine N-methyltransferase SUVR1 [Asparagus officinalis]XP_020267389.1 probable inactive histone-lysine N-methyltransferase SUVR1 [Asparagus officinalis]ONK68378.1 uncharacterized protein A4U43_C05F10800 [Asparagus officinalis]